MVPAIHAHASGGADKKTPRVGAGNINLKKGLIPINVPKLLHQIINRS